MTKLFCVLFVIFLCGFIWAYDRAFWKQKDNEELFRLWQEYGKENAKLTFQKDSIQEKYDSVVSKKYFSIMQDAPTRGYLSSKDWETFNKQPTLKSKTK